MITPLCQLKASYSSDDSPCLPRPPAAALAQPNSHLAHERLHTHYVPGGVEGDK